MFDSTHPGNVNFFQKIEWFKVNYLPTNRKDNVCKEHYGLNPNAFFMVIPFVKYVILWILLLTSVNKFI